MHLTRFSDIGLRVLLYLAKAGDERRPVTVAEIANQFTIPQNHLVKVVAHLAHTGWVYSQRGRNGGLRLQADPQQLRLGTVLKNLEGENELIDCDKMACTLLSDCRLRAAMRVGMKAFYDTMDKYSLDDMARGHTGEKLVQMHRMFLSPVH
ncbi:Rrf2 family transcriptional regulator [Massilia sp. TS11]|uniref:RrF2 family transcriptional regulator n=1 Tax=Massilia sp. TS11 TaxID=2908003 RepID=UPI001EDB70AF|nr:Rrf2 family transcriptional regulator [Massilia sp. TS11]MCG2586684.1 Rrf2 family transcriptional regulator [Massilia sp. TS11]